MKIRVIFLAGLSVALLTSGCTSLPTDYPKTVTTAFEAPETTGVGGLFERAAARHPGKSGFVLLAGNREAFTDRIALADFAEKTLDVQYFIWSPDTVGRMIGDRIIQAAERGVRVRFLLDDINFEKRDSAAAALSAHPNIEVRIFNPNRNRTFRGLGFLADFGRLNKRMHNKIMAMDNACVIVGGRNIADSYFGLSEKYNNRDLDIAAMGPIVQEISKTFDEFWNSDASVPIEALVKRKHTLEDFRAQVEIARKEIRAERYPYPLEVDRRKLRAELDDIENRAVWAPAEVFYDSFRSMAEPGEGETVADRLGTAFMKAEKELLIESAYFVVKDPGIEFTRQTTDRGVKLRVLTNSLASNNVLAAQTGHSKNRKKLVDAGMDLYEMRPDAAVVLEQVASQGKNATTTLHTKALVIDEKKAFVGSFNLDPRSADINSEIGIMIESPVFARQLKAFLDEGVREENAYRVTAGKSGGLIWETTVDGEPRSWNRDPETSWFKRFMAGAIELLPIQDQL